MLPSWNDIGTPAGRGAQASEEGARFDALCASIFSSGAGKELMTAIRARTIEMRSPPGASEAILREQEAVRRFVVDLERATARGLAAAAKGEPPPA